MSNSQIARILLQHKIPYFTKNGHIYALIYRKFDDLTGSSKIDLLAYITR